TLQEMIGIVDYLRSSQHLQLISRGSVLNDARDMSHSHFTERIGAMAAIIENQTILNVDGIQEIGAETKRKTDHPCNISRQPVISDVAGLQFHRSEETQIVRWRHKHECVRA